MPCAAALTMSWKFAAVIVAPCGILRMLSLLACTALQGGTNGASTAPFGFGDALAGTVGFGDALAGTAGPAVGFGDTLAGTAGPAFGFGDTLAGTATTPSGGCTELAGGAAFVVVAGTFAEDALLLPVLDSCLLDLDLLRATPPPVALLSFFFLSVSLSFSLSRSMRLTLEPSGR